MSVEVEEISKLLAEHDAKVGGKQRSGIASGDEMVAKREESWSMKPMERLQLLLPDVESLTDIPRIQARLELEILDLREEISALKSELARDQDPERMQAIQNLIGELITQITLIREKASEAEAIVKTITKDIQRLDVAKRNLMGTMTTVKRWTMLIQAHEQLKHLLQTKQYRSIANSLSAVNHLSTPLKPLVTNPPVAQVFKDTLDYQAKIKESISRELEAYFVPDPNRPPDLEVVKEACLVVDVLGPDYRNHIIERYVSLELRDYRKIFSTGEAGQLDNTARRYAWFRRLLKSYDDEKAGIFPESWETPRVLTAKFIEGTRGDLTNALAKSKPAVNVLLEAWQATSEWESAMSRRFNMPAPDLGKNLPMLSQSNAAGQTLTEIFGPYFSVFVDAQDKALEDMLSAYRGAKSRSSFEEVVSPENEAPITVLPSSTELFYFYGQTLDQCARYTTGKGMVDLAAVFKKWLRVYSDDVLIAGMKNTTRPDGRRSAEGRPNLQEVRNACLTLNTADYCMTTGAQLEEKLKSLIDDDLEDSVSLQSERDQFVGVVSACLVVLLRELESACEPSFAAILKTPWVNIENVSGRSAYVVDLVGSIKTVAEVIRERIEHKKYIRSFADKAVGVVMTRFTGAVVKSRPLRTVGAEQILLDVQAVKSCLLDLPDPSADFSNDSYSRLVLKATGQLETMLKVVMAPEDPSEGFVQNYCLLIGDKSFSNFQKILDLKGTPRSNQQKLLDIFLSVTSAQEALTDTSFLTGLDMDPDKQNAVMSPLSSANLLLSPTSSTLPNLLRGDKSVAGTSSPNRSETPKPFGDFRRLVSFAIRGDTL